jgi:glycosyltransferase involved in cell wall biosynthesis
VPRGVLSIVAPVYNEEALVEEFIERVLAAARVTDVSEFELILVNDGSRDRTGDLIVEKMAEYPNIIRLVEFSRNFGQQAAFYAGLSFAQGDFVVTLDSDLQDPPEVIPKLVQKMREGFDIVYAKRVPVDGGNYGASGHTGLKSLGAYLFHLLMSRRRIAPIPRDVGEYRCMRRDMVQHLMDFSEYMIFLPGLVASLGFVVGTVDYVRQRRANRPQASVWTLAMRAFDALTTFSVLPLNFILGATLAAWLLPFAVALWMTVDIVAFGKGPSTFALTALAALTMWCVTLTAIGIMAHYLGRMFLEIKSRPRYFIKRTVGVIEAARKWTTSGTS